MPLYEYRCTQCQHRFEVYHHVGGSGGPCPVCGGPTKRIFSSIGLIFKGSGFHTTDYRKQPPALNPNEASGSGSSDGAKSETAGRGSEGGAKTEQKAEPKTEKKTEGKTDKKS